MRSHPGGAAAIAAVVATLVACHVRRPEADPRELAIAEAQRGNPVSALRMLQRVVAREPADSEAYAHIADLYRRHGWVEEGRSYFGERSLRAGRSAPELGYVAAAFAAFAGDPEEARQRMAAARRRRAPSAVEALAIAEALGAIGADSAARGLLAEAARTHGDHYEARVRYAQALAAAGDTAEALRETALALAAFPAEPRVVGAAATVRYLFGDLAGSEALTRRWLVLAPNSAEARWNLARIALRRGDYQAADSLVLLTAQTGR